MSVTINAAIRGDDGIIRGIGGPELNVANGNFATLMSAIGFPITGPDSMCGTLDSGKFADKLAHFVQSGRAVSRAPVHGKGSGGAEWHDFGISEEQGQRYINSLWEIIWFAFDQNAMIAWG